MFNNYKTMCIIADAFIKSFDNLEKELLKEKTEHNRQADALDSDNRYSDSYKQEFRNNFKAEKDYKSIMNNIRAEARKQVIEETQNWKRSVFDSIGAPASQDFINWAVFVKQAGYIMTDDDFILMQNRAKSLYDLKILKHLADTRTKLVNETKIDENGNSYIEQNNVLDVFPMDIISADAIIQAMDDLKTAIINLFDGYAGQNDGLGEYIDNYAFVGGATRGYLKGDYIKKYEELIEKANKVIPLRNQTEVEKKLIDLCMDSQITDGHREKVLKQVMQDETLKEVFSMDSRYSDKVNA